MLGGKKYSIGSSKVAPINFEHCSTFPLASQNRVMVMCPQQPDRLNCLPDSLWTVNPFREN